MRLYVLYGGFSWRLCVYVRRGGKMNDVVKMTVVSIVYYRVKDVIFKSISIRSPFSFPIGFIVLRLIKVFMV